MSQITTDDTDRRHTATSPVVVGVDDSAAAIRAAQWAAVVADARCAPLHLVHVARRHVDTPASAEILDTARRAVRQRWARTSATLPPAINMLALRGDPATRLIGLSADACEVVVGSASRTTRSMLGSVATTLAASAHCPVAVIRPPASGAAAVGPVLVVTTPTDSGASLTLSAALRAATERRSELVVVTIARPTARSSAPRAEHDIEALLADHGRRFPTVRTRLVTYFGHTRTAIEKFCATAQLVVTTRQRRPFWPPLSGMSYLTLQHTRCAVLVVPEQPVHPTAIERLGLRRTADQMIG
ncbi:universal stress protein [Nocardia neocaledoniensis]|uniref:universal stress protein n=1 Tax=Nocardia neocaledoniensis TaxID=236511 RepID=UPI002458713E|nr:universal stress protein [Nocardia neocaledoniensis]